jgi:YidC/Oxa1 family membrane protein insertase
MDTLINAFNVILYQPLFNALVLLYQYLPGHDFGVAVIALTVIIRLIFYPLMVQSIKSQKSLSELQPKIQEIQSKYKNDKEKQARATMELYQKEKVNPFGGCLPLLIQLPILIALYRVFWQGFQPEAMGMLYNFVPHPGTIDPTFLGIINLGQASLVLAVLAGITQFFQTKMITPKTQPRKEEGQMAQFSGMMQKQMLYFFPILTVFILWKLPAAIGLYWIITALFSIMQQHLIFKKPTEGKPSASYGVNKT